MELTIEDIRYSLFMGYTTLKIHHIYGRIGHFFFQLTFILLLFQLLSACLGI
jgi:hypothetical protein